MHFFWGRVYSPRPKCSIDAVGCSIYCRSTASKYSVQSLQRKAAWCSVCTAKGVYYYTADTLPFSCSVPVVYTAESEKCICSIYCTSTALRSGVSLDMTLKENLLPLFFLNEQQYHQNSGMMTTFRNFATGLILLGTCNCTNTHSTRVILTCPSIEGNDTEKSFERKQ